MSAPLLENVQPTMAATALPDVDTAPPKRLLHLARTAVPFRSTLLCSKVQFEITDWASKSTLTAPPLDAELLTNRQDFISSIAGPVTETAAPQSACAARLFLKIEFVITKDELGPP